MNLLDILFFCWFCFSGVAAMLSVYLRVLLTGRQGVFLYHICSLSLRGSALCSLAYLVYTCKSTQLFLGLGGFLICAVLTFFCILLARNSLLR